MNNDFSLTTGRLPGDLPFVRLGDAPEKLIIFPGLADGLWDVTSTNQNLAHHHAPLAKHFSVYVISRRRRLPPGHTTRDMAADYAQALSATVGPAHVLGISLGGMIAQYFAADFPHLVNKLVIASAAHHTSEAGAVIPRRWLALAQAGRWREFYADLAKVTIQEYHHTFYQFLLPLLRHKQPGDPTDFLIALEASLAHDSGPVLAGIRAPTLVIAGSEDRFFPQPLLRELSTQLPNARLQLIEHVGHGAYAERHEAFDRAVLEFLSFDNQPPAN